MIIGNELFPHDVKKLLNEQKATNTCYLDCNFINSTYCNILKRILHILFATVFTILTVGVTLNKHYSNGDLFSIALFGEAESCCEVPCDCCDEETEVIQFVADYISSDSNVDSDKKAIELFSAIDFNVLNTDVTVKHSSLIASYTDLPPPKTKPSLSQIQSVSEDTQFLPLQTQKNLNGLQHSSPNQKDQ